MDKKTKILVVDDEEFNLDIIQEYLETEYENLKFVEDGFKCLSSIEDEVPDIVLLDVSMPGLDGYEVCEKISQLYPSVSVIFVSARGTPEERLKGYEAGGVDYIIKPFSEEELIQKIERVSDYRGESEALKQRLSFAESTAFDAMINASEMGQAIAYLRNLFSADSVEKINQLTLGFTSDLELNSVVRSYVDGEYYYLGNGGTVSPIEKDLIEMLSTKGRIFSFAQRMQVNFDHVNILVKNMPVDSDNKMGRFRDLIPIGLEGADNCLKSLSLKEKASKSDELSTAIQVIDSTSSEINNDIALLSDRCTTAVNKLNETINAKVPFMGLEGSQEDLIVESADAVSVIMQEALDLLSKVSDRMEEIKQQSEAFK